MASRQLSSLALAGALVSAMGFTAQPAAASTYVTGKVEASPSLTVRTGPGTNYSPAPYTIGYGASVYIACYNTGTQVSATWGGQTWTTNVWAGLWDGSVGRFNGAYVSDAWVNTGGDTSKMVPHC